MTVQLVIVDVEHVDETLEEIDAEVVPKPNDVLLLHDLDKGFNLGEYECHRRNYVRRSGGGHLFTVSNLFPPMHAPVDNCVFVFVHRFEGLDGSIYDIEED